MRIVVLGAGALGAYFGARFQEAGAEVTFLVREKRAEQVKQNGILVNSTQGDYEIKDPKVITDPKNIPSVDLVFVGVKGYHLSGTLDQLKVLTEKGAYILPVLNGMEHIRILQDHLGKGSVIGGLSFIIATLNDNGHVEHSSEFHDLIFGALEHGQINICKQLENILQKANINARNSDTILLELWKKYMFINAFSGITTSTNLPIGPVRDNKETLYVAEMLLEEMKLLANAYNVEVTNLDVEEAKQKLPKLNVEATSSMHQDRRKGLPLELDHLHGGAIRLAEKVGISLPYTKAVYGIIKPFENT